MVVQGSSAGVGYWVPPLKLPVPRRQMKAGPSCSVPVVVKPALCSRFMPVLGSASQPRTTPPPQWPKSTATIAPVVAVQSSIGSATAARGLPSSTVPPAATATAPVASRDTTPLPLCRVRLLLTLTGYSLVDRRGCNGVAGSPPTGMGTALTTS